MPTSYPTTSFKLYKTRFPGIMGPVYDLELGPDGGPQLVSGSPELAQTVEVRLRMIRGEAWEDVDCGLWARPGGEPNGVQMGQKPGNKNLFRFEILQELRKEERITQIDSLTISEDVATRTVQASAVIRGVDGSKVAVEF